MSKMKKAGNRKEVAIALALAAIFLHPYAAKAMEQYSPFAPGATTGVPAAALPPVGVYFKTDEYFTYGELKDQNGHSIPVKVQNATTANTLLWVPPVHILGARYATGVIQIFAQHNFKADGVGGRTTSESGLFNTILIPASLSWSIGHASFIGSGLAVYIPDGEYAHDGTSISPASYANNFWTFEPNVAYSYLGHGWDLTLNNVFDINTTNPTTHYHSGVTYYADITAAHQFGAWTFGAVGNYTKQFTPDDQFGEKVSNSQIEHVLVGPMVAYDFGKVTLSARFLDGIMARNDVNVSFLHIAAFFKF